MKTNVESSSFYQTVQTRRIERQTKRRRLHNDRMFKNFFTETLETSENPHKFLNCNAMFLQNLMLYVQSFLDQELSYDTNFWSRREILALQVWVLHSLLLNNNDELNSSTIHLNKHVADVHSTSSAFIDWHSNFLKYHDHQPLRDDPDDMFIFFEECPLEIWAKNSPKHYLMNQLQLKSWSFRSAWGVGVVSDVDWVQIGNRD